MTRHAYINGIESYLPSVVIDNAMLAALHGSWTAEDIALKTGIRERRICDENENSASLATGAALRLFEAYNIDPNTIDFLIFCTQTPTSQIPTNACLIHRSLALSSSAGAIDINQGCAGYVYAIGLAQGLIESTNLDNVLVLTGDHYSKFLQPNDISTRALFGDAGTATLVSCRDSLERLIGPFVFGTDSTGAEFFCLTHGADHAEPAVRGKNSPFIEMNGPEIFNFTLSRLPEVVDLLLRQANLAIDTVDFFVFHQANRYMLEHLRKKIGVAESKFLYNLEWTGNTVSSTIPLVLQKHRLGNGDNSQRTLLAGFGVGLSWGATAALL